MGDYMKKQHEVPDGANEEGHLEQQCWICPWCYDDHSQEAECKSDDLKAEIKKLRGEIAVLEVANGYLIHLRKEKLNGEC